MSVSDLELSPATTSDRGHLLIGAQSLFVQLTFSLVLTFTWFALPSPAAAEQATFREPDVQIGWNRAYFIGRSTRVLVEFEVKVSGRYQLTLTTPDPDGHRLISRFSAVNLEPGSRRLEGFLKLGRPDLPMELRVEGPAGSDVVTWKGFPSDHGGFSKALKPGTRLVVTVGGPKGFVASESSEKKSDQIAEATSDMHAVSVALDQLPTFTRAYDGVSLLVLSGRMPLSEEQSHVVRDWVAQGGRVAISLPAEMDVARRVMAPLSSWLPVALGPNPIVVREFSSIEKYAGRNVRVPSAERRSIPSLKFEQGTVLAGSRDEALMVRVPYGLGSVTVLALDLTREPLSEWEGVSALARQLLEDVSATEEIVDVKATKSVRLSSTGVTDLATQLHAIQDEFDGVTRASPWLIMGLMVLFLMLIGPVDYVLIHYVLRRPRATWLTLPAWVTAAVLFSSLTAVKWNGEQLRANQFQLLNIDSSSMTLRSRLWTNLYSPKTTILAAVQAAPVVPATSGQAVHSRQQMIGWSGIPETTFGGMYRTAGLEIGRTSYEQAFDQSDQLHGLPLMQWSSKSLMTETVTSAEGLVESNLESTGSGRLRGTLTHRLEGQIEDWFLAFGNRVYRQSKTRDDGHTFPLPSRQLWRVEQPNVFQRELRPFLTGQIAVATRRSDSKLQDVEHRQVNYNPLSRDPLGFARTLTFHKESGGSKYTGLTNRMLDDEDLSHLLKLGRAVLFGRLSTPASSLGLGTGDSSPSNQQPDRGFTFVRLVFPVKVVSEASRTLESFDPNKSDAVTPVKPDP